MDAPLIVAGPDHSGLPFCDIACFHTFTYYQDVHGLVDGRKLKRNKTICHHCSGCGRLIFAGKDCVLHEEGCPPYLWIASYPTVIEFVDEWFTLTGSRDIPETAWRIADNLAKANPLICGSELAQLTFGQIGL